MRTLQLLRHAKSSWDDPALDDHDRPLSERGRAAAALVGARLAAAGAAPGLILCSTALRARETCEGVVAAFDAPPPCRYDERLYLASGGRILDLVGALGDEAPARVMAIGHDPGLRTLAAALAEAADPAAARKLRHSSAGYQKYPAPISVSNDNNPLIKRKLFHSVQATRIHSQDLRKHSVTGVGCLAVTSCQPCRPQLLHSCGNPSGPGGS